MSPTKPQREYVLYHDEAGNETWFNPVYIETLTKDRPSELLPHPWEKMQDQDEQGFFVKDAYYYWNRATSVTTKTRPERWSSTRLKSRNERERAAARAARQGAGRAATEAASASTQASRSAPSSCGRSGAGRPWRRRGGGSGGGGGAGGGGRARGGREPRRVRLGGGGGQRGAELRLRLHAEAQHAARRASGGGRRMVPGRQLIDGDAETLIAVVYDDGDTEDVCPENVRPIGGRMTRARIEEETRRRAEAKRLAEIRAAAGAAAAVAAEAAAASGRAAGAAVDSACGKGAGGGGGGGGGGGRGGAGGGGATPTGKKLAKTSGTPGARSSCQKLKLASAATTARRAEGSRQKEGDDEKPGPPRRRRQRRRSSGRPRLSPR